MSNSRYFSTQPSANAVPASQVMAMMPAQQGHKVAAGQPMMMPAQQGHMLAAGQPMVMPGQQMMMGQQQPMMMMPTGQQPMAYAPAQMQQPMMVQQQQVQATLPNNVQPKLEHAPGKKQFTVTGVDNPHLLVVQAPNLSWQMTKLGGEGSKNYLYSYDPAGQMHDVSVKYNGGHVEGSPFQLVPNSARAQKSKVAKKDAHRDVVVSLNPENKHLVASNVPNVDKLHFETDMAYKLLSDSSDKNKFHFQYDPQGAVHLLDVSYDGKPVPNGQFEMVPKAMQAQYKATTKMESAKREYEASIAALENLQVASGRDEESEEDEAEDEERETPTRAKVTRATKKVATHATKKVAQRTSAGIPAQTRHMTQGAPNASYGPMVMSHQPMMPQVQAQQQAMMPAAQPMMMQPMSYANGGNMTPPMYQMVPQQQQQFMQQQQQPRMYQQQ